MIFLDSSYILAILLKKDTYHALSKDLSLLINDEKKMINITVMQEVLNSINAFNYNGDVSEIIGFLFSLDKMEYLSETDYMKAIALYKYYNKSINFSDCTILVSMENNMISNIVSFDGDFDKVQGINRISGF